MTNLTLKDVLRATTSVFTVKNLLKTASAMFFLALLSFVVALQYYSAKTSHQNQVASALPSFEDMETQVKEYVGGEEVIAKENKMAETEVIGSTVPSIQVSEKVIPLKEEKVLVKMESKEYKKGDKMKLKAVSFHAGSNVLMKKAEPELQKLLAMLKQNPKLKVRILGHTDENYSGKIKKAREEHIESLFNPESSRSTSGNSRKLSVLRVKIIESYLVKNGISGKRIATKGWGGKKKVQKKKDQVEDTFLVEVEMLN